MLNETESENAWANYIRLHMVGSFLWVHGLQYNRMSSSKGVLTIKFVDDKTDKAFSLLTDYAGGLGLEKVYMNTDTGCVELTSR